MVVHLTTVYFDLHAKGLNASQIQKHATTLYRSMPVNRIIETKDA